MTCGTNARNTYFNGSSRSCILGFNVKGNVVEHFGCSSRGNNDKAVRYTAFRTVGGFVYNLK